MRMDPCRRWGRRRCWEEHWQTDVPEDDSSQRRELLEQSTDDESCEHVDTELYDELIYGLSRRISHPPRLHPGYEVVETCLMAAPPHCQSPDHGMMSLRCVRECSRLGGTPDSAPSAEWWRVLAELLCWGVCWVVSCVGREEATCWCPLPGGGVHVSSRLTMLSEVWSDLSHEVTLVYQTSNSSDSSKFHHWPLLVVLILHS